MLEFGIVLTTLALAVWVGSIVFQTAVVAPSVFTTLDIDDAGRFLRGLFPRFFTAGAVCGVVMLLGLASIYGAGASDTRLLTFGLTTGLMLVLQIAAGRMVPAINAARDQGEAGKRRFGQLHGINVGLTVLVLLLGLFLLGGLALAVVDAA